MQSTQGTDILIVAMGSEWNTKMLQQLLQIANYILLFICQELMYQSLVSFLKQLVFPSLQRQRVDCQVTVLDPMPGRNVQVHYVHSDILTQSERPL
jgi:hypothetical protein